MVERARSSRNAVSSPILSVVIPIALLLAVIAILAGLVFGGVLQGDKERNAPVDGPSTPSTIIIEP